MYYTVKTKLLFTELQNWKNIFELNTGTALPTVLHTLDPKIEAKKVSPKVQFLTLCTSVSPGELQIQHGLAAFPSTWIMYHFSDQTANVTGKSLKSIVQAIIHISYEILNFLHGRGLMIQLSINSKTAKGSWSALT